MASHYQAAEFYTNNNLVDSKNSDETINESTSLVIESIDVEKLPFYISSAENKLPTTEFLESANKPQHYFNDLLELDLKFKLSFLMGTAAIALYFFRFHDLYYWGAPIILVLTIPTVCFASADGYGWANDLVQEGYGAKRAIQVNVATGNGTELLSAISAFANGQVNLANSIVFSAMIINGLFVPSLAVLSTLHGTDYTVVTNKEKLQPYENYINLQVCQTICVFVLKYLLQPVLGSSQYAFSVYLFYAFALYYYIKKIYVVMHNTSEELIDESQKQPWAIIILYSICTIWIMGLSYIATQLVPMSATILKIDANFFSVIFALEGAIPELYKSIVECRNSGDFICPRSVSTESNAQLCGFVLPVAAIFGSLMTENPYDAIMNIDLTTCGFYAVSTLMCFFMSSMETIEIDVAGFQLLIGVFYLISLL